MIPPNTKIEVRMSGTQSNHEEAPDRLSDLIRRELIRLSNQARTEASRVYGGGGFAARRSDRFYLAFLKVTFVILFLIPMLAGGLYYLRIASNQYITESYVSLNTQNSGIRAALSGLLGSASTGHVSEVVEYIRSPNIIADISSKVNFSDVFSKPEIDIISRLESDAPIEKKVKYWRKHIEVDKQSFTSQIRIRVRAFSPEDSLALHEAVLEAAEKHVNDISRAEHTKRMVEAEQGLERARAMYTDAVESLRYAREEHGMLDAASTAEGYEKILTKLRESEATLERRIETIRERAESSPQLRGLTPQLDVVKEQISYYEALIAAPDAKQGSIAASAAALEAQEMDLEIARNEFASRMAVLEGVKSDILEQAVFMQQSVQPSLPEESTYPKRWLSFLSITGGSLLTWLLTAGLGLLIRDNMT